MDGDVGTKRLNGVDANVDVSMATADEQIRVSDRVKRELDRRRREGESYNDVLERVLDERTAGGDFEDGFGRWSDEEAERVREQRRQSERAGQATSASIEAAPDTASGRRE